MSHDQHTEGTVGGSGIPPRLIELGEIPRDAGRRLARAADEPHDPMRLMVVATVSDDGRPNARTLVLRGADDGLGRLWYHTDVRAAKVSELRQRPSICAVAYDPRDGVQLCLYGAAAIHENDAIADRHWSQVDLATRHLYLREERQAATEKGQAGMTSSVETDPRTRAAIRRLDSQVDDREARRSFAVIEVTVERVEWLQTLECGLQRAVMRRDAAWCPLLLQTAAMR